MRAAVFSISPRRHVALQQLEVIAATAHGFLGPNKRLKFIEDQDRGEAALVRSCARLLENMELDSSVGQLLYETAQAQQKLLHSGTNTLMFLAGIWSRVALECLHSGMTVLQIKTAMNNGLQVCLEECRRSAVCLEEVSCKIQKQKSKLVCHRSNSPPNSKNILVKEPLLEIQDTTVAKDEALKMKVFEGRKTEDKLPQYLRLTLKHSRHFNSNNLLTEEPVITQSAHTQASKSFDVSHIAQAVRHGCETSMNLVLEAYKLQSGNSTEECWNRVFDIQKLVTCPVSGPSEKHSRVLHGYVVLVSDEQFLVVRHLQEQTLKIALVNGDLSESYRHVGFNSPANVTHVTDCANMTSVSREERWIENAFKTLCKLSIDVLLVNGVASIKLKDRCVSSNILVIEGVRTSILKDFSRSTGAVIVSYFTQLNEQCVGRGVKINRWREFSTDSGKNESTAICITTANTSLVTAVITSSISVKLQSLEDEFWGCAHRLHQALTDRKLLPGAAATELLCIHQLHKSTQTGMESPQEKVVMRLMADGWMDYISTLMLNSEMVSTKAEAWTAITQVLRLCEDGEPVDVKALWDPLKRQAPTDCMRSQSEGSGTLVVETDVLGVYDNMTMKLESWRRALDLVLLVLQSDTEIITGISEGEDVHNKFMYL